MLQVKELEQVEQMELETLAEALPTSKALREKKLKMKETIDRVIKCYEKESDKDMVCSNFTFLNLQTLAENPRSLKWLYIITQLQMGAIFLIMVENKLIKVTMRK